MCGDVMKKILRLIIFAGIVITIILINKYSFEEKEMLPSEFKEENEEIENVIFKEKNRMEVKK